MDPFGQVDIGGILNSNGSVVSCVLLRARDITSSLKNDQKVSCTITTDTSNTATNSPPSSSISKLKDLDSSESLSKPGCSSSSATSGKVSPSSVLDDINTKDDSQKKGMINSKSNDSSAVTKAHDDSGANTADTPVVKKITSNLSLEEPSSTTTSPIQYELAHLVSQIQIDTTPKKREVEKVLGGPFTFIGQYEDLGVVVMALVDSESKSDEDEENDIDENKKTTSLPWNPHKLQPPLHDVRVRGDILMLKVNAIEDDEENEETATETKNDENSLLSSTQNSNSDFFLNFTRDEYLEFASRTDIPIITSIINEDNISDEACDGMNLEIVETHNDEDEINDSDNDEDDEYLDNEEEDGDYEEEMDEEEERVAMMNLLMGQIIRRFREENDRGPDTKELLQMRQALAMKLGVEVPDLPEEYETKSQEEDGDNERSEDDMTSKNLCDRDTKVARSAQNEEANCDVSDSEVNLKKRKANDTDEENDEDDEENNCNIKKKRVRWSTCLEESEKDYSDKEIES